jgi:hypothetical protein
MGYYSAYKKKEILSLVRKWINLQGIMLTEITQAYMWNLKGLNSQE